MSWFARFAQAMPTLPAKGLLTVERRRLFPIDETAAVRYHIERIRAEAKGGRAFLDGDEIVVLSP